ncbi:MAG TPA: AmmeMemoRadiSam system protein B [Gemmataceae bacterium]|jgi:AmmeMemoRadiSam system protein B|nr:AmmeMemoRadiSam system protein B [Gemmataceae bacterium]
MNATDTPRLRRGLQFMAGQEPGTVYIADHFRLGGPIQISRAAFDVIRLFDGEKTLHQLQAETAVMFGGEGADLETLGNLVAGLDQEHFLDSPRLHARLNVPDRPPACIGCYDADPDKARRQLRRLFTAHGGPGLPGEAGCRVGTAGAVKAVLLPHMDYARGGVTYGWGLKELVERTDARLFVIVATSHYSGRRFTLTRQNFTSPLGRVETDQAYIDRLVAEYGDGLFGDPFAHVVEHSIELEVVGMQYVFEGQRDFRIVPLLVGSFFDCVGDRVRPGDRADVAAMIGALRRATAAAGEPVCYVISGDLAHIGPKFDDEDLVSDDQLTASKSQDDAILAKAVAADADGYFDVIAGENDARRICGLPPTYVALEAARPKRGSLLQYGRFVHPEGLESVSFASVGFE